MFLRSKKTGFAATDSLLTRITISTFQPLQRRLPVTRTLPAELRYRIRDFFLFAVTVQTGALTAIWACLDLIAYVSAYLSDIDDMELISICGWVV